MAASGGELLGGGLIPRHQLAERDMLVAYLARQRELVCWKVAGLRDEDAHRVATPSGLTVHGIVHHLANAERSWLRRHFAGQEGLTFDEWADPNAEARPDQPTTLADLVAAYRAESARCDEAIATADLDQPSAERDHTLRWILFHLIEETSRHLGHLDLLTELADGRVGEEPEGAHPRV